mgnify:CR=1 FL=1
MSDKIKYHKGDIVSNPWTSSTYYGKPNYFKYFVFTSKNRNTISGFRLNYGRTNFEKTTFCMDGKDFKVVGHTKIIDEFINELDTIIENNTEEK